LLPFGGGYVRVNPSQVITSQQARHDEMTLDTEEMSKRGASVFQKADQFAQLHLVPNAPQWGRGLFDRRALFEPAGAAGLLSLQVPLDLGGFGLSFGDKVKVLHKLSQIDFSAAMALVNSHNVAAQLVNASPHELAPLYVSHLMRGTRRIRRVRSPTSIGLVARISRSEQTTLMTLRKSAGRLV